MNHAKYVCAFENCSATFEKLNRYKTHLLKHTGERPYECIFEGCDKTYTTSFHLTRHEETHNKMFKCTLPGCSQILKTKATLQKHQDVFHAKIDAKKKYKCSECDEVFAKHSMLTRHIFVHSGVKAYKCSEPGCDKSFSMPSLLKRHTKRHIGYYCKESDCLKYFPRWSLLCKHKKECHPKIFTCIICEKSFNYACNLRAHILTHKLEKDIFRCTVPKCVRVYQSQRSLSTHMKKFHETFTIACPEGNCPRFVRTEEDLEIHIRRRHRRRRSKKKLPRKPDFAEVLSGFAKGTQKDLNPHHSNIVLEEIVWKSKNGVMDFEKINHNSTDNSQLQIDKEHFDDNIYCSKQTKNINSDETCSNRILDEKIKSPYFDKNDKQIIDAEGSKSNFNLPFSNSSFKDIKSQDGFIEIEVVCQNYLESSQCVENSYLGGEDCCNPKADHSWISTDMPTGKVT